MTSNINEEELETEKDSVDQEFSELTDADFQPNPNIKSKDHWDNSDPNVIKTKKGYEASLKYGVNKIEGIDYENTITDEFYGIKVMNPKNQLVIQEIYSHQKKLGSNQNDAIFWKREYTLYNGDIGTGNSLIIIKSRNILHAGTIQLCLKNLTEEELKKLLTTANKQLVYILCKILKISNKDDKGKSISLEQLKDKILVYKSDFYEPAFPMDIDELKKIGNPLKAGQEMLKNGLDKDEDMDLIYLSALPELDPDKIDAKVVAKYSNNQIVFTGEKAGKSTNALLISGETGMEKASEAGLLGFADAKQAHYGKLHMRTKQTFIEELSEEKNEELFGKVHSVMEQGEMHIPRGIGVYCTTYSGITFQGNPKNTEHLDSETESYLSIKEFSDLLKKVSTNTRPFSSRIAVTYFNKNNKRVTGTNKHNDYLYKSISVFQCLAEAYKTEFTMLFYNEDVLTWLNTPHDKNYSDNIQSIIESCHDNLVKQYFHGQFQNYRHMKGSALRLAWLNVGIESLWNNKSIDISCLLDNAEQFYDKLKVINSQSFMNILSLTNNSQIAGMIAKQNIQNIRPEYSKLLIYTVLEWLKSNPTTKLSIITFGELQNYYPIVKQKLNMDVNDKYRSFYTVRQNTLNYANNSKVSLNTVGLDLEVSQEFLIIQNRQQLLDMLNTYSTIYPTIPSTVAGVTCNPDASDDDINNSPINHSSRSLELQQLQGLHNTSVTKDTEFTRSQQSQMSQGEISEETIILYGNINMRGA